MTSCIKKSASATCYLYQTDREFRIKLISLALGIIALIGITIMAAQGRPLLPQFNTDVGQLIAFIGIVGILICQVGWGFSLARDVYKKAKQNEEEEKESSLTFANKA